MRRTAREAILTRIREGLGHGGLSGETGSPTSADARFATLAGQGSPSLPVAPRRYRTTGERSKREALDLFAERISEYRATVSRCPAPGLPQAIAGALLARGVGRLVVPADLPDDWLEETADRSVEVLRDGGGGKTLSKGQLASAHGVLTGCALGIAETGTLVLDAGPAQGRRALTLLPDYHLCVVFSGQVVETVPEAVAVFSDGIVAHRRPITLVSGPSATSDIELVRVEGVHGPRTLEVILVEEAT